MADQARSRAYCAALLLINILAATSIVFVNKLVLSVYDFRFIYFLTLIHSLFTLSGMMAFSAFGLYKRKAVPVMQVLPLACAFVGYIVLWNICLRVNSVVFYQLSKIMITPGVVILQAILFRMVPSTQELAAVAVLCIGVGLATVSGGELDANVVGVGIAVAAIFVTSIYQIWVGSKQKQLQLGSMQLMHEYVPQATLMLAILVPLLEPMGLQNPGPGTIRGYQYTWASVTAIGLSAALGLAVSLSTFLVIGAVGSLAYNVVGHLKTVTILLGGCLLFGDTMPLRKLAGVVLAMCGIAWYSYLQLSKIPASTPIRQETKNSRSQDMSRAELGSAGAVRRNISSADLTGEKQAEHRTPLLPVSKGVS